MPRRRSRHPGLPPRLQKKGKAYYYTPYVDGRQRWIPLGSDYPRALRRWAEYEGGDRRVSTVADALDRFLIEVVPLKADATQREYRRADPLIRKVFGRQRLDEVRPSHIAAYLTERQAMGAPVAGNREVAYLSTVYSHAIRWGAHDAANPCLGVARNRQGKRDRWLTDEEIAALKAAGGEIDIVAIDLVLLTALRRADALAVSLDDATDTGLRARISKRSRSETGWWITYEWTPALRELIERAERLPRRAKTRTLLTTTRGRPFSLWGWDTRWQRLVRRAGVADVHFHDLRARALTDAHAAHGRDYAQALAAHVSGQTTELYIRARQGRVVRPIR